jgi:hypothetical protein
MARELDHSLLKRETKISTFAGRRQLKTSQIIQEAGKLADTFIAQGLESVRLPVFDFMDWCAIYKRPSEGASIATFRDQVRRTWYLLHFLRKKGVEVTTVPVRQSEFLAWAQEGEHDLSDGHETAHAVGEYVNDPAVAVSRCNHKGVPKEVLDQLGPNLATISIFGENPDEPEAIVTVVHRADGSVLNRIQVLAIEHSPEEAWELTKEFLDSHKLERVFHDQNVRRPEFCPDCNSLMGNVASPEDIKAAGLS